MKSNAIFFLSTAATSMSIIFIPVIASEMGADNFTVGVIVSMYGVMALLSTYLFGWMSDNRGRLALIRCGMLVSAAAFGLQVFAADQLELVLVRSFCGAAIGVFYSSLVIYGIESGKKLGKYTSFESLGWGVGNLVAGIIAVYNHIFALSALLFIACFFMSLNLGGAKPHGIKSPIFPYKIMRKNAGIFLPFLMRDVGAYSMWTFFPLYLMALGADSFWVGAIYFLNTGGQFFMKQVVDRFDFEKLYTIGLASSALSFLAYMFPENHMQVIPIQFMIAFAWTTLSVGAMGLLTERNVEKASVIGLFSSTRGLAQIIAPIAGGVIMQYAGFRELILFSAAITAAGLAAHLAVGRGRKLPHIIQSSAR